MYNKQPKSLVWTYQKALVTIVAKYGLVDKFITIEITALVSP